MKRFSLLLVALFFCSAAALKIQASQTVQMSDPCIIEAQVAYNRTFQAEYARTGDIDQADSEAFWSYAETYMDCSIAYFGG